MPSRQTFIPFNDFNGTKVLPAALRSDPEDMKAVYMMISFSSKCTQFVAAFGLLIQKIFHTHQMTYEGERIIGWAIQDGNMDATHPNFCTLDLLLVRNSNDAVKVVECVNNNRPVPTQTAEELTLQGNSTHIWLTFVTESGRVYDLDLSSWQFGPMLPFPCIMPIDIKSSDLSMTLNGMCKRDRLLATTMKDFGDCIQDLLTTHVAMVKGVQGGNPNLTLDVFKSKLEDVGTAAMNPVGLQMEMPSFDNSYHFWNRLRKL